MRTSFFFTLILVMTFMVFPSPVDARSAIETVTSKTGVTAWLVKETVAPVISIHFAFRGGVEQDPPDRQGLASLTAALLTQGAGRDKAEAFQKKLNDNNIALNFVAGRDAFSGAIKFLREDRRLAVSLLRASLQEPRFDDEAVARMKLQQTSALRAQFGDPLWQARVAMFSSIYAGHPYGLRSLGSVQTVAAITKQDIQGFARRRFARDNLVIAVAGHVSAAELSDLLDDVFGGLPEHAESLSIPDVVLPEGMPKVLVERDGTQTNLFFVLGGIKRDDPDWYALEIANYILGGGGFSSRLMQQVRENNGLTYGIGTALSPMRHGGLVVGQAATGNDTAAAAWAMTQTVIRQFYEQGVSEDEVVAARRYLIGSMPLALTATDKISSALVSIRLENLGIDYFDRYAALLGDVSVQRVNGVIRRLFDPERLALVAVGQPEGMDFADRRAMVRQ